jgi:general secretion pathway protein I
MPGKLQWTRGDSRVFAVSGEYAASAACPPSLNNTRNQRGFTLLEVLVATIIMAVAVSGLLSALTTAMHNAARLTDRDRAITLARQQMNELLIANTAPKEAPLSGLWDPALTGGRPCGWNGIITLFEAPTDAAPGDPALDRVHLEVWCGDGDAKRTFTMEAFRHGLVSPGEAERQRTP